MATPNLPPRPAPGSTVLPDLITSGVAAWSDMTRDMTQLFIDSSMAQAKTFADLCAASFSGMKVWPSQQEWLLMVENQAEQMADGVRHTLRDLNGAEPAGPPTMPD